MRSAPATYDQQFMQELVKRVDAVERRFGQPLDKITLRASDDQDHLKDITVDASDVITATDSA